MNDDMMNNDEKIIDDRLNSYYTEKTRVHIILKRTNYSGQNIFLNGLLTRKATERVWIVQENVLGEIRLSISEIKDVEEERA